MKHGLTDEQRVALAKAIRRGVAPKPYAGWNELLQVRRDEYLAAADAAVAFLAPVMLAEPIKQEIDAAWATSGENWIAGTAERLFANRLADWTREPDPRIEAVLEAMAPYRTFTCTEDEAREIAAKIIAAVDRARKAGE